MALADEYLVKAVGWEQFDVQDKEKTSQEHLDFSHKIAKLFKTNEGKELLSVFTRQFLLVNIVNPNDTQFAAGIKQGRADVIKQILAHIEISNNSK